MGKAKTVTEVTLATIKENEKTIVDEVMVELKTGEYSLKHKVLHGSFKLSPEGTFFSVANDYLVKFVPINTY